MNNDPLIYARHAELQKLDAAHILEKYSNLIRWAQTPKVLDIGSAEGSVSLEVLLSKIPSDFHRFVMVDISPDLINFARGRSDDPRIDCLEMDIAGEIPRTLQENFDHIFSFYCLQHIDEERTPQAMRNIFDLLKPGGRLLVSLLVTSPLYGLCENMMKEKKWPSCMDSFQKIFSPYLDCENPDTKLRTFLEKAGFDVELCEFEERNYAYVGWENFLGASLAILPFSKISSEAERNRFVEDFITETKRFSMIRVQEDNGVSKIWNSYSILVAVAEKPSQIERCF